MTNFNESTTLECNNVDIIAMFIRCDFVILKENNVKKYLTEYGEKVVSFTRLQA